nr:hypothetical protein [Paenibacillus bovis]
MKVVTQEVAACPVEGEKNEGGHVGGYIMLGWKKNSCRRSN